MTWRVVEGLLLSSAVAVLPAGESVRRCARASVPAASQSESLLVVARRAAFQWQRHDFAGLIGQSSGVMLQLPGTEPSAPLRPAQAVQLLQSFVSGVEDLGVEVLVVREVAPDRAYAEAERKYRVRGTSARRTQSLYFGWRREGAGYRLVEVRVLP